MDSSDKTYLEMRQIIERALRSVLHPSSKLPSEDEDWIESGLLDSMGHVEFMLSLEKELKTPTLFSNRGTTALKSTRAVVKFVMQNFPGRFSDSTARKEQDPLLGMNTARRAGITGWGATLGTEIISVDHVEREFGMAKGSLRDRAGIETVRRVSNGQNEISLAKEAAGQAIGRASVSPHDLSWIITSSETFQGFPSFGASVHNSLLSPATCKVLEIGGGCVGLLNCLSIANRLFADSSINNILVVSADVHSRILIPGKVHGEFGGLFGDGASAFVLQRLSRYDDETHFSIQASIGSCAGAFSSLLQIRPLSNGSIDLRFDGEALGHAAIDLIVKIIGDLESALGVLRGKVAAFAFHQPNPRLTEIILRATQIPSDKAPLVAKTCGNLGGSTCGVALCMALDAHSHESYGERGPIFAVSVGPGMLWTGIALRQYQ
jgi:3-oxoacyl-[acyl-carrier-protein] synthase III